jgi:hypothetical protein
MRRILVENARRKGREKHGGGQRREHADLDALSDGGTPQQILALHEAHEDLALHDPVKRKLVELRFFVGLPGDLAHQGRPGLVIRPRLAVRRHGRRRSRKKSNPA